MENEKKHHKRVTKSEILKIVLSDVPLDQVQEVLSTLETFQRELRGKYPLLTSSPIEPLELPSAVTPG
jgi:hypothetical protein